MNEAVNLQHHSETRDRNQFIDFDNVDLSDLDLNGGDVKSVYEDYDGLVMHARVDKFPAVERNISIAGQGAVLVAQVTHMLDYKKNELQISSKDYVFCIYPMVGGVKNSEQVVSVSIHVSFFSEGYVNANTVIWRTEDFAIKKSVGLKLYKKMQNFLQCLANQLGRPVRHVVERCPISIYGKKIPSLNQDQWCRKFEPLLEGYDRRDNKETECSTYLDREGEGVWTKIYKPHKKE